MIVDAAADIVAGPDGTLHVAVLQLEGPDANLLYAHRSASGSWTAEVADATGSRGVSPSIAVDGSGAPHIVHTEFGGDYAAYYTRRLGGGAWTTERILGIAEHASDARIALGPSGGVHVVVRSLFDLVYAKRTAAGVWETVIERYDQTGNSTMSFLIDPTGRGHVTYGTEDERYLVYATRSFCR